MMVYSNLINTHEFCAINNAEQAPEISNEFITITLENKKDSGIGRDDGIDYARHFCHWLFINGHTCSKLSMIN